MTKKIMIDAVFNKKGKIAKVDGKWVVRRSGTVNGRRSTKTTVCDSLFSAIKERYGRG